jgi:hypothetical protein
LNLEPTEPHLPVIQDAVHSPPESNARKFDLEELLLEFAAMVIDVSEKLPDTRAGNHIAGQLLRAGTSPYGNHGEAQSPSRLMTSSTK